MDEHKTREQGFFEGPPKTMFTFGVACGVAVSVIIYLLAGVPIGSGSSAQINDVPTNPVAQAPGATAEPMPELTKEDWVRGDLKKAKVVMVEYSDYECPFCSRHHPTLEAMVNEFGDDIAWVYRHFPLTSIHTQAMPAAVAAECAGELGGNEAFWLMTDALFENQTALGQATFERLAKDLGLNEKKFLSCLTSGDALAKINAQQAGGASAGVTGTPGTFINGQLVPGAVPEEQIRSIIQSLL